MPESVDLGMIREERDAATIGVVEAVSPNSIEIAILPEAPHGTGLREGALHRFPRINSYVVLPSEAGSILAIVSWVGISEERLTATQPRDQIGLPVPRRRLRALPLGVLRRYFSLASGTGGDVELDRGVLLFPTVGDPVRLPTRAESLAALPTGEGLELTVPVGQAILAGNAEVRLDPNRLFGRHLAVLGNTGSGKSCSVAQLLRSSVQAVGDSPTAFSAIILDLNGEYTHVFDDIASNVRVRHFNVMPSDTQSEQLRVPYWLWNYREWLSFTEASSRGQAPQLRRCLHLLRTTEFANLPSAVVGLVAGRRIVRQYEAGAIEGTANAGSLSVLDNVVAACQQVLEEASTEATTVINRLVDEITPILERRRDSYRGPWAFGAHPLNHEECARLRPLFDEAIVALGIPRFLNDEFDVDVPIPFDAENLVELLPLVAADSEADASSWVSPLVERLRVAMADDRQASVSGSIRGESLEEWLRTYVPDQDQSQITVIDLSLVPSHVVHVIVAVFTRALLEAMERYRRLASGQLVPRILVVEEAHSLIRRYGSSTAEDHPIPPIRLCREAFERVAREGRKFGLSLVISSQRPSELSETVLSQCNTFVIHRIVNDQDQRLVRRLVPDNLGALMDELPALPSQTSLIVGWALDIPALVRIADLDPEYRPRAADPDFVGAWRGRSSRALEWGGVVRDWIPEGSEADTATQQGSDLAEDEVDEDPF